MRNLSDSPFPASSPPKGELYARTADHPSASTPIALTIAGSDSGGGAGIQADLKTFSALGVYGASAITALTAQNTLAVTAVHEAPASMISAQIEAVFADLDISAVKCGMLSSPEIIGAVAAALQDRATPIVLDPVMVAKSGAALLHGDAVDSLRSLLLPLATVLTPNLPEAARLLDTSVAADEQAVEAQGRALLSLGAGAVLMKGGHAAGERCVDLLITPDSEPLRLEAPRISTKNTHGTGCTLSAAIAAGLARGMDLPAAVRSAHSYLHGAIQAADSLTVGSGHGPVHHFYRSWSRPALQVNVIGAGVVGLCVATELATRGLKVSVYDKADGLGPSACSWWAGGMLAPWCERESAEEMVSRLGAEAAAWWSAHAGSVTERGSLVLALGRDQSEVKRFARRTEQYDELDGAGIRSLEPHLGDRFRTGLHFAGEAHLAPRKAIAALADRLRDRGVPIHFRTDGKNAPGADLTLDCRGLAARDELHDLRGVKGEMLLVRCPGIELSRPVRLLHPRIPIYVVPRGDGFFMIGATMIESDERSRISARSMLELLGAAYALHPAFGEAEIVEIGVDARPAFPDNLPRLRRRGDKLYVNGLYRHGFLLSPAMARMAADAVMDEAHVPEVMDEHSP